MCPARAPSPLIRHLFSQSASLKFKKLNKRELKLGEEDSRPMGSTSLASVAQLILFQLQCDEGIEQTLRDRLVWESRIATAPSPGEL